MLEVMLEVITPEAELTPAQASIPLNVHISSPWEQACMSHDSEHERKLKIQDMSPLYELVVWVQFPPSSASETTEKVGRQESDHGEGSQ